MKIAPFKDRELDFTKPVKVHWHFTKKTYAIEQGGLIVGYSDKFYLQDADFTVSESGRQRVIREKKKNVHAHVWGFIKTELPFIGVRTREEINYNPYKNETFVTQDNKRVSYRSLVLLTTWNDHSLIFAKY
jgi:hypothetical protein